MGIKFTPEAFADFDKLDPDSKKGVLESMAPEDQDGFVAAYEQSKQPQEPGLFETGMGMLKDNMVGTYKRLAGFEVSPQEAEAVGVSPLGFAVNALPSNKELPKLAGPRLVAGDVLTAVHPGLGVLQSMEGGEQDMGLTDAEGNPTEQARKAALQLPEDNRLAAVTRFVPQMAANLVGDVGLGVAAAGKFIQKVGPKATALVKGAAAAGGAALENFTQETLGGLMATKGDLTKTAEHLKDVATNPLAMSLMVLPGVLAARAHGRKPLPATVVDPDLRTVQQIMQEGGEVRSMDGLPEQFEVTKKYGENPQFDLTNPGTAPAARRFEPKTEPGTPSFESKPPTKLGGRPSVDPRAAVEAIADAGKSVLRTQANASPFGMHIPGPIEDMVENAAVKAFNDTLDSGAGWGRASEAAENARSAVITEWLTGRKPVNPLADASDVEFDMRAFGGEDTFTGDPRDGRGGNTQSLGGDGQLGGAGRPLGDVPPGKRALGESDETFMRRVNRQMPLSIEKRTDNTDVRRPALEGEILPPDDTMPGSLIDAEFKKLRKSKNQKPAEQLFPRRMDGSPYLGAKPPKAPSEPLGLPEGHVRGRGPGGHEGPMPPMPERLMLGDGQRRLGRAPSPSGPPIQLGAEFPTRAPQGALKPEFRRPIARDMQQVMGSAKRKRDARSLPEGYRPPSDFGDTVVGPAWAGKLDAAISGRNAKADVARRLKLGAVDPVSGRPAPLRSPAPLPGAADKTNPGVPPFRTLVVPEALRDAVGRKGTLFYFDDAGNVKKAPLYEDSGEGLSVNVKSPGIERLLDMQRGNEGGGGRNGGPPIDNLNRPPEWDPGHPSMSSAAALKRRVEKDSVGWDNFFRDLQRAVSIPSNYAAREVAPYLLEARASAAIAKAAFEKNVKPLNDAWKQLSPTDKAQWESVMKRVQNKERVNINEVPQQVRDLTKSHIEGINKRLHFLSTQGYFDPKHVESIQQQLNDGSTQMSWLTRDYELFYRGKDFRAEVPAYQKAIDGLKKTGKTEEEAHAVIREVMDAYYNRRGAVQANRLLGGVESARQRSDLEGAVNHVLKERKLPEYMRPLFGEITDPRFTLAMSAADMERMTQQYAWTKAFTDSLPEGSHWVSEAGYDKMPLDAKARFHPQKVWIDGLDATRNKQAFGELAGKYVARDVWEAMMGAAPSKLNNMVFDALGKFQSWFRASKTLFSPMSFVRNYTSNTMASAAAGLPVWDPRWAKHQVNAIRSISEFNGAGSMDGARVTENGKWLTMAMEDNAIPPGRGSDIIDGEASRVLTDMINEKDGSLLGLTDRLANAFHTGKTKLAHAYELMDSVPRLAVYRFQVERGLKSGLTDRQARGRAAQIVNRYFASSVNLGPHLQQISKIPLFGPFMGWAADNVRVHKNIAADATRALLDPNAPAGLNPAGGEGMGPLINVMLHKALFLSALGAAARTMFGVTDEEHRAAEESLSDNWKMQHPLRTIITVPFSNGQLYAISLDAFDPTASLLRGDPSSPITNIVGNTAKILTEGGFTEPIMDAVLPLGAPSVKAREEYPAEFMDAAQQKAWDYFAPGILTQYQAAARKTQIPSLNVRSGEPWLTTEPLRSGEEPLSGAEALNRYANPLTAPFMFEKVGPRTATATRRREAIEVKKTATQSRKISANPNLSPAQKAKYKLGAREQVQKLKEKKQ